MMIKTLALSSLALGSVAAFTATPASRNDNLVLTTSTPRAMVAFSPDDRPESSTTTSTTSELPPLSTSTEPPPQKPSRIMSQALPFLQCPVVLQENLDMAGNVGFDPLNLAQNTEQLWNYREAEIKHARLAMLAAVGWPASELWDRAVASQFGMDPLLDDTGRAPSLLNGGLGRVSPIWWGFCIGLCAAIDMYGLAKARRGDPQYRPGMLGFDPLNLYPADQQGQARVELAEIKHGRLAMVTVVSYSIEEWVTKIALVDETPGLFVPLTEAVEQLEQIEMLAFE